MDSDATIDSDGNEKEDSQGKRREKRRKKARGRLGTHRTSTAAGEERSLSHPCCTLPAPLKKTSLMQKPLRRTKVDRVQTLQQVAPLRKRRPMQRKRPEKYSAIDSVVQNIMQYRVSKSTVCMYV
jgi:hypothetical protein